MAKLNQVKNGGMMGRGGRFVVAGCKAWNRRAFGEALVTYPGEWTYVGGPEELTGELVRSLNPDYIFFFHWSWKVPEEIIREYRCVCFHMTDVPYGRGGSPLQNLIVRGHRETKLSALLMTKDFDAGPVYLQENLCLGGNAEEIYIRATHLAARMIKKIIEEEPEPKPQVGEPVTFQRRRPEESRINSPASLGDLHDFIRMLDAEGYPRAFVEVQGYRYEFSRSALYDGQIVADVRIRKL